MVGVLASVLETLEHAHGSSKEEKKRDIVRLALPRNEGGDPVRNPGGVSRELGEVVLIEWAGKNPLLLKRDLGG